MELDKHINRLVSSAMVTFGKDFEVSAQRCLEEHFLRFLRHVKSASAHQVEGDVRYTTILDRYGSEFQEFEIVCISNPVLQLPPSVDADVQYLQRHHPQVKSTDWAIQRKAAEESKRP